MQATMRFLAMSGVMMTGFAAHAAAGSLPGVVAADLASAADACAEVGGKALTDAAVLRADLNGDGREDYVLDVGAIDCDGAPGVYGDRDKAVSVYAGDGAGGAKQAFSEMAYSVSLEGTGPAAKLWLTVSGPMCGKKPAQDFASEAFCDRHLVWNAKAQKFDFAPVSTVRMIQ